MENIKFDVYSWANAKQVVDKKVKEWNSSSVDKIFWKDNTEDSVISVATRKDTSETIGICQGNIYTPGSHSRVWQWVLCVNIDCDLYIDAIDIKDEYQNKGIGTKLLSLVEDYLKANYSHGKKNIYVRSVHASAWWWYRKGYTPVQKNCKDERTCKICEDYPTVFRHEHCIWMAKPIENVLDQEESEFDQEWCKPDLSKFPHWLELYVVLKMKKEIFEVFKEHFENFEDFKNTVTYPKNVEQRLREDYFCEHIAPRFGMSPLGGYNGERDDPGKYRNWCECMGIIGYMFD